MTEERMIRVVFEEEKDYAEIGYSPLDPIFIKKEHTEPMPIKYVIEYGDGDEEEFYALNQQQHFLFSHALATEHYWFYDINELNEMFEKETIKVIRVEGN